MSKIDKPKPERRQLPIVSRGAPNPRQKLRSRRDSSAPPTFAPRRTQAERSEATRKQLLEAAIKLVRVNGFGGLRTVEVSELAGVSRGALLHHFKNKHALIVAVLRYVNELSLTQSARRAQIARTSGDPIKGIIEDAKDFYFGDIFFIELAIAMSVDSSASLKRETYQISRPTRFSIEAAWLDTLVSSGMPKQLASDVLALTLSVVRGFSVRMLIEKDVEQFIRLLKIWRDIIHQHIKSSMPDKPGRWA
jgi:AcrR family transcriptional regulator